MRWLLILMAAVWLAAAQPKPDPPKVTIEFLAAEVESLRAQLAVVRLEYAYSLQVCNAPDLMAARLDAINAAKKAEAAKPKQEPAK